MLRSLKLCFVALTIISTLTSCFDTVEEFTFNDDGSGSYSMKVDMIKMFEMMGSMLNDSSFGGGSKDQTVDSTWSMQKDIDAAQNLSSEEKNFFRNGQTHLEVNLPTKKMYFQFDMPFKNQSDFQKYYPNTPKALSNLKSDEKKSADDSTSSGSMGGFNLTPKGDATAVNQFFDIKTGQGFFERKIKKEELKKYFESDSMMTQMKPMLGNVYCSTILHFQRPVKSVSNPYATISDDKKTVTFKFPFSDYTERPEVFNFRIEY